MATRRIEVDDRLARYLASVSRPEPEWYVALREETASLGGLSRMQIGWDQAELMGLCVRMLGARRIVEVGTFTGTSALAMALALPHDGRLYACDLSPEWTAIARRHWEKANVASRIDLRLGPALATLASLRAELGAGSIDLAFIDADKSNYLEYWERCVELVRPGGAILVDNVLWGGSVADPEDHSTDTEAIRKLNQRVQADERVAMTLLPIGDGLTVAVVR